MRGVVEGGPGVGIGEPEVGPAVDDDHVVRRAARRGRRCGRAAGRGRPRRGRRARRRVVSSRSRSASGVRWGWTEPSGCPAFEEAVSAPTSSSGCWRRRRTTSPPAYPLAPATATRFMCMTIQSPVTLCTRGQAPAGRTFPAPMREPSASHRNRRGAEVKVPGSGGKVGQARRRSGEGVVLAEGEHEGALVLGEARRRPARAATATVSSPARTKRPDQASSSPETRASTRSVTSAGSVHSVRPSVRVHRLGHVGAHDARHEVERPDAARPPREVRGPGEPGERRLADVVGAGLGRRAAARAPLLTLTIRPPPAASMCGATSQVMRYGAEDVDLLGVPPLVRVGREDVDLGVDDAGVVDEHVDAAVPLDDLVDPGGEGGPVGDRRDRARAALDGVPGVLERVGDVAADAAAGAGDDGDEVAAAALLGDAARARPRPRRRRGPRWGRSRPLHRPDRVGRGLQGGVAQGADLVGRQRAVGRPEGQPVGERLAPVARPGRRGRRRRARATPGAPPPRRAASAARRRRAPPRRRRRRRRSAPWGRCRGCGPARSPRMPSSARRGRAHRPRCAAGARGRRPPWGAARRRARRGCRRPA